MPTERLEIDIIAKGKPAERAIDGVDKKTKDLEKTTKKAGETSDNMLSRLKAGWVAVGATIALSVNEAVQFERASVGLSREMRKFAKDTALSSQATAEQIAGFLKSAQTAGLADDQMKKLAKDAIALGYAFPHEDAETLHDNLVMLNTTGEAQGFIVDILEQQYAKMGKQFDDIDLKAVSLEEKLRLVENVISDSNKAMQDSALTDYDAMMGQLNNTATDLGQSLIQLGAESGAFGFLSKTLQGATLIVERFTLGFLKLKDLFSDTDEARIKFLEQAIEVLEKDEALYGKSNQEKIKQYTAELNKLTGVQEKVGFIKERTIKMTQNEMSLLDVASQHAEDYYYGLESGVKQYYDQLKLSQSKGTEFKEAGLRAAQGVEDAFVKMAMTGKLSFNDMANAIIADLVRITVRRQLILPFLDAYGFHTGTDEVMHTGGTIGLPSYHNGMRSDERLAKLQVGEAVINRYGAARNRDAIEAMNSGYKVGGGNGTSQTANITFNVQAFDQASFQQGMVENRATIVGVVREAFNRNGQSVRI